MLVFWDANIVTMHIYIHTYIAMYVCLHICVCMYACMHGCMHTYADVGPFHAETPDNCFDLTIKPAKCTCIHVHMHAHIYRRHS
jgi:hypothetical protein